MITADRYFGRAAEVTIADSTAFVPNLRYAKVWRVNGGFASVFRLPAGLAPHYRPGMNHALVWNDSAADEPLFIQNAASGALKTIFKGQVALIGLFVAGNPGKWGAATLDLG